MSQKIEFEDISKPSVYDRPFAFLTIAAIGPSGEFVYRHINSKQEEIGDVPIRVLDGHPVLSPRYRKLGWCLYSEMCRGEVKGVDADADAWKRWTNLVATRAAGREPPRGAIGAGFFHPEVERRRLAAKAGGGVGTLTVDQMRELFPGVEIKDPAKDVGVPATVRTAKVVK